jgi:hypothetical protein
MLLNNRFGLSRIGDGICCHATGLVSEGDHQDSDHHIIVGQTLFLRVTTPLLGSRANFGRADLKSEFTITRENVNHE